MQRRILISLACLFATQVVSADQPRSRLFTFDYGVTVKQLSVGDEVRIWMPVPPSDENQTVEIVTEQLPGSGSEAVEPKFNNQILHRAVKVDSDRDSLTANRTYRVERKEVIGLAGDRESEPLAASMKNRFLAPSSKVPTSNIPLSWQRDPVDILKNMRNIYDRVDEHVRYDKSKPGYGTGDVLWVCDSRFGNCSDFHSLFISMARASNTPARFEIGFPLPSDKSSGEINGYHCWASFYTPDHRWVPVDISEADKHPEMKEYYFGKLTPHRVRFTVGRDIDLVPQQSAPALNFFVYPHVEINGKPATKEQLQFRFAFQNEAVADTSAKTVNEQN